MTTDVVYDTIYVIKAYDEETSWIIQPVFVSYTDATAKLGLLKALQVKIDAAAEDHPRTMIEFFNQPSPGDHGSSEEWASWEKAANETIAASLARFDLTPSDWDNSEPFTKFTILPVKVQR